MVSSLSLDLISLVRERLPECAGRQPRDGWKAVKCFFEESISAPGRLQFLWRDIDLQPPLSDVRPFPRKQRIEWNAGGCQGFPKNFQLLFWRKAEQFE
jgi:hypothetical protein